MSGQIKYPRRVFIRQLFRLLGRFLLPLLADIRISGKDKFPQKGPLIVVGNHTAAMEMGIREVYNLALWARDMHLSLHITPARRFKNAATGQEIRLERPEEFVKW
jgi:hypothetical protein